MRINKSGNFIVRGQTTELQGPEKIQLFDGTYKSGFRIVDFQISSKGIFTSEEVQGKITTDLVDADIPQFNWQDTREVAWACTDMVAGGTRQPVQSVIDTSMILVEDLFVYVHNNLSTGSEVNFLIELEPVNLKEYEYAMSFIQNRSQGVG